MDLPSTAATVLPLAVGIAASPVPVIAVTLLLVSPRAVPSGLGFLVGWVVGVLVLITGATLLVELLPQGSAQPPVWAGVVSVVLGAALVVFGLRQGLLLPRRRQPLDDARWLSRIDRLSARAALGLGLALSALNPKNLTLALSAGLVMGASRHEGVPPGATIAAFTLMASASVAVPVLARALGGARLEPTLQQVRRWVTTNHRTIVTVLATVLGAVLIAQGVGNL